MKHSESDELEDVLRHVGEFGRYQKILFLLLMPFGFFFAFVYFVQMFITLTPATHFCAVPELAHLDLELRRNLTAPLLKTGGYDKCRTFVTNWTQVLETLTPPSPETETVPCRDGWVYDYTDIRYSSVVTERDWVCENAGNVPLAQAIFFVGAIVGGLFFGWLADEYGRVPALIGSNLVGGIGGIMTIYTNHFIDFAICRFLVGMAFDNGFMMAYILVLEYVSPRHRTLVANLSIALYFGAGCLSLPWLAVWIGDWRMLLWVTSGPMLISLVAGYLMPESARWYASRGRVNSAVSVLRKFERVNGTKIPDDVMDEFIMSVNKSKTSGESLLVLAKSAPLRVTMLLMFFVYMSCSVIFDGLVRMSDAFGLDFFIAFTMTSATEMPSVVLLAFLLDRLGRRSMTAGPMFIAGVLILVAMFVPKGIPQALLAVFSRFCINMAYNAVIQWATELLPTGVRASGSAALHISGYVSALLSPYIVFSERLWTLLPLLIIGVTSLVACGASLVLPETKGRPMPQTMADGEAIVRGQMLCGKRKDIEEPQWKNEKEKALIT
ncbi:solute carrier family 22 member 3-like isoform X2 [Trichoplusia ni]|nr:solute carrier family 22 member 3-like isoform X2 [Trichoplusia ni]XP_026726511.1 solute carrier family 22 member 3-like isoform X2 [Trichoplusia ni]XP_026726512.1 solute carrier family 22 member 3-like isoform X2 [Trichoplusia ni]XP_026726514.1 solute carrier family 22 member 3-like isoform X2 [Trichoplusia ni]